MTLFKKSQLYPLSALLILAGSYMLSVPWIQENNHYGPVKLFALMNSYEFLLLAIACYILKKKSSLPESQTIVYLNLFFVFDITFTASGCAFVSPLIGSSVMLAGLLLAWLKYFLLSKFSGQDIFGSCKWLLFSGTLLLYALPPLFAHSVATDELPKESITLWAWTLFGLLPLLFLGIKFETVSGGHFWQTHRFKRNICLVTLGLVGAHLWGQTWLNNMPFEVAHLIPVTGGLLIGGPTLFTNRFPLLIKSLQVSGLVLWLTPQLKALIPQNLQQWALVTIFTSFLILGLAFRSTRKEIQRHK